MKLYMITQTLWAYELKGNIYRAPRPQIIRACLDMGFPEDELEFGIKDALTKGNNSCDFGDLRKTFLFSKFDEDVCFMVPQRGAA